MNTDFLKLTAAFMTAAMLLCSCAEKEYISEKDTADTETDIAAEKDLPDMSRYLFDVQDKGNVSFVCNVDGEGSYPFPDSVGLTLNDNGSFFCGEGLPISHVGIGTWSLDGDILTAYDVECERTDKYRLDGDDLIFIAEGSAGFSLPPIKDGDRFVGSVKGRSSFDIYPALADIPDDYSPQAAKLWGMVVMENGSVTFGEDVWYKFVESVEKGETAKIRYAEYYSEDLLDGEEPILYVHELKYDGECFTVSYYEDGKEISQSFKYLRRFEGTPDSSTALFSSYIVYVLTDNGEATGEELWKSTFSSQLGAYIPHTVVFSKMIMK